MKDGPMAGHWRWLRGRQMLGQLANSTVFHRRIYIKAMKVNSQRPQVTKQARSKCQVPKTLRTNDSHP